MKVRSLSPTKLLQYQECPHRFFLENVKKEKKKEDEDRIRKMQRGSAIHDFIHTTLTPIPTILPSYDLKPEIVEEIREIAKLGFCESHFAMYVDAEKETIEDAPYMVEESVLEEKGENVFHIRGKIDFFSLEEVGKETENETENEKGENEKGEKKKKKDVWKIVDWKTGKTMPSFFPIRLYSIMLKARFSIFSSETRLFLYRVDIENPERTKEKSRLKEIEPEEENTKKTLFSILKSIEKWEFPHTEETWKCPYCEYIHVCEYGKKEKERIEEEKKEKKERIEEEKKEKVEEKTESSWNPFQKIGVKIP